MQIIPYLQKGRAQNTLLRCRRAKPRSQKHSQIMLPPPLSSSSSSFRLSAGSLSQILPFHSVHRRWQRVPSVSDNGIWCVLPVGFSSMKKQNVQKCSTYECLMGGCKGRRLAVIVEAKKAKTKDGNSKYDNHNFIPKVDEATGPFPESVLLKKKSVQEDGKVLPEFADAEEEEFFEFLSLQLESDLNVERVRHYEVVYLIHEDRVDEVESVVSKFQDFVREKKGRIWRLNNWGMRRLAYKIKKASKANYILMNFELEAKCIDEFKMLLDKDERIIRHLVIKRDEAITEDCPPPPEFHTMFEGGLEDDNEDDDDDEDEDYDEDGLDDEDDNIIAIDEEEDAEVVGSHTKGGVGLKEKNKLR